MFVCATTGNGDAPENAERFWRFLKRRTQPKDMLKRLHYAVLVRACHVLCVLCVLYFVCRGGWFVRPVGG